MFFCELQSQLLENNYSKWFLNCACANALKIAEIPAAQASAQLFRNSCGASAIAIETVAARGAETGGGGWWGHISPII